ncbi:hypothetical protein LSM04_005443 [Trypanosoma melophagium]|uniref:uncharacterized protein n=1 Tax=Trypanosoma melophagium TaxID=715481 RepID=UPI00351AAC28|nr:hypothetical protein LSM04_005443 [Trypanosoma melophagium]
MLHITIPLCNARKLALRLFREEQRHNSNLDGLSAVQKSKVIKKMFRQLAAGDMDALKRRAAAWEAKRLGHIVPTEPKRRREVTPYELFFKEQQSNPSIASIHSPSVRERKLFAIFNSLPVATREALEQRARELSEREDAISGGGTLAVAMKSPLSLKKTTKAKKKSKKQKKKKLPSSKQVKGSSKVKAKSKGATTKKNSIKKKKYDSEKKKTSKKQSPSPYAVFVKEQMPQVKHLPTTERMKVIAQKWKSMKENVTKVEETPVNTVVAEKQEK